MTTAPSEPSTQRTPGRTWKVRLTGHSDRSATVTCSTGACRMLPRSKNLTELRTFAARHVAAHAKAATVRHDASCRCRAQGCAAHEETAKVQCAGPVVMILRHDRKVGQVWILEEVCQTCAAATPHATVLASATRPRPAPATAPEEVPAPVRAGVPGGFSSHSETTGDDMPSPRRPRTRPRRRG